ncbi:MAG: aconitase X catalytic domain-containing protein [Methanomicrobiales archaeon]|nr:aconitase X catalytic domain-containing protein [Methanomicrobiales archaeon]MDD1662637.1 aconitase X catalytic domain-containing protein [Methanomicrobiales archaeon]
MDLTREEEGTLEGGEGETRQRMMELLVGLGKVFGASRLIPIASAQVSGASYKTIGRWGLAWLESLDAKVTVPTILNPVGMDRERWREAGIPPEFAENQEKVLEVYRRLGVRLECTCTPYEILPTRFGEHLAWAESSAVVYANSVIGARTNREGGPGALAAAIIGKTPCYGLHLDRERAPNLVIRVDGFSGNTTRPDQYGALGFLAGKVAGNRIPFFRGIRPAPDEAKAMGAAMAATGAVALFHVEGVTPEAGRWLPRIGLLEVHTITSAEVRDLLKGMEVEAVAMGCPHCSAAELAQIARLLRGKKARKPLFVFTSRWVMDRNRPLVKEIEASGARVYADTCMVVSPMMESYSSVMVDSGKAYAYVPSLCGAMVRIGKREECVAEATGKAG